MCQVNESRLFHSRSALPDFCHYERTLSLKGGVGERDRREIRAIVAGDASTPGARDAGDAVRETEATGGPAVRAARCGRLPREALAPGGQAAEAAVVQRIAARHGAATVRALAEAVERDAYLAGRLPVWPWPASWQWLETRVAAVLAGGYGGDPPQWRRGPAKAKAKPAAAPAAETERLAREWRYLSPGVADRWLCEIGEGGHAGRGPDHWPPVEVMARVLALIAARTAEHAAQDEAEARKTAAEAAQTHEEWLAGGDFLRQQIAELEAQNRAEREAMDAAREARMAAWRA